MQSLIRIMAILNLALVPFLVGCSTVTFIPLDEEVILDPKPDGFDVELVSRSAARNYTVIGSVSCQDSAASSIWNWWTDQQALIVEMKAENKARLMEKIGEIGGDVLIDLTHDLSYGGSSGGVGLGVGVGRGPVGVGVGTSLLGGNPKIVVVSYGEVGIVPRREDGPGEDRQ